MTLKQTIMENPFNNKPVRPTFITVLCILSFIGSGWSTLSNMISVFTFNIDNVQVQIDQISNAAGELEENSSFISGFVNPSLESLVTAAEHGREIAIISLLMSLASLIGAILMFNLRKLGFYIYTAAQLIMLITVPLFSGFSPLILVGIISSAIPSIVFIILYAVNLKHMH